MQHNIGKTMNHILQYNTSCLFGMMKIWVEGIVLLKEAGARHLKIINFKKWKQ